MNIHFAPDANETRVRIKVVGVGGAGGNAVNRMVAGGLGDIDFHAVNTDGQALEASQAHQTLVIGSQLTRGLGAGGDPDLGRRAAEEDRERLAGMVDGADMVFVTAGMGGGTGTGAAPVVAELARQTGALTVAVVTRPFLFEGRRRAAQAESGLDALRDHVDALLVIPNERLMEIDVPDAGMNEVFRLADNVLYEATRGISDIISQHAVVNLDFADVRTVMQGSGAAIMGTGHAEGDGRAARAAEMAITSPLLEDVDIIGSRAVLVYVTAGEVTRDDLRGAMTLVQDAAGDDAHVFFGFANDTALGDDLRITVIATGFPAAGEDAEVGVEASVEVSAEASAEASAGVAVEAAAGDGPEAPIAAEQAGSERTDPATASGATAFGATAREPAAADPDAAPSGPSVPPLAAETPSEPLAAAIPRRSRRPYTPPRVRLLAGAAPPPAEGAAAAADAESVAASSTAELAAMAAVAGGRDRDEEAPARQPSETSQRFLEPLGKVKIGGDEEPRPGGETTQRFRPSVLGNDKTRPAWERKYVD